MIWRRGTKSTGTRKRLEKFCRRATGAALPTAGPGSGASRSSCDRGLARSRHDSSGDDCLPDARMSNGPGRHACPSPKFSPAEMVDLPALIREDPGSMITLLLQLLRLLPLL